jgi:hypothetical protein
MHRRRFKPEVTVLFLRYPVDTYESLFGKTYANEAGLIDEKFSLQERSSAGAPVSITSFIMKTSSSRRYFSIERINLYVIENKQHPMKLPMQPDATYTVNLGSHLT